MRHQRHANINNIIHRALGRARINAAREPTGLIPGSSHRPDGSTLIPWSRGKYLAWDATVPDSLAASNLPSTCTQAGAAAKHASSSKQQKYHDLPPSHLFVAVAIETLGPWNCEGLSFIKELGRRISIDTGDPRETTFLLQKISVAVQMGNAVSIIGSLPLHETDE